MNNKKCNKKKDDDDDDDNRPPPFEFVAEYVRQLNHQCDYEDDELLVEEEGNICGHTTTNLISIRDVIYQEAECEADAILNGTNDADDVDDYDKESTTSGLNSSTIAAAAAAAQNCDRCCNNNDNDNDNNDDNNEVAAMLLDPQEVAIAADVELIKRYSLLPHRRQQQQEHDTKNISNTPIVLSKQLFNL
jgi:hypothetical protein